jgi:hypothetical protein
MGRKLQTDPLPTPDKSTASGAGQAETPYIVNGSELPTE